MSSSNRRVTAPRVDAPRVTAPRVNASCGRALLWGLGLPALLVVALGGYLWRAQPAQQRAEISQDRAEAAVPVSDARSVGQTFGVAHGGLTAIELLLARYTPDATLPADARLVLTLQRLDRSTESVVVELSVAGLGHNDTLRFDWAPLADSAGGTYLLTVTGEADHGLGLWHSATEAYAGGTLLLEGAAAPGDLYLRTYYHYPWQRALSDSATDLRRGIGLLPALFIVLMLPGLALALHLPRYRADDGWQRLVEVVALSLAVWALLFLWAGTLGLRLTGPLGGGLALLLAMASVVGALRGRTARSLRPRLRGDRALPHAILTLVMALVLLSRISHVRGVEVPLWVDSVHHTLLTRLLGEVGGVPETYRPYLPVDGLHYHFGFHAATAALAYFGGLPPHRAVLIMGQVLGVLAPLAAYALAVWLLRSRWAGVGAAVVAGALSYLPAYSVSWGRYTQLAGLLMLPPLCSGVLRLATTRGHRIWPALAILSAGLALTHYRVLLLYAAFWPSCVAAWAAAGGARRIRLADLWGLVGVFARPVGLALAGAAFLTAPWIARFAARVLPAVGGIYGGWVALDQAEPFPTGMLTAQWMAPPAWVALGGLGWALLRRRRAGVLLGVWIGLWFLMANLRRVGLADIWLLDNEAVIIALWLPIGALGGFLVADLTGLLTMWLGRARGMWRRRRALWAARGALLAAAALALAAAGTWHHLDIVNPVTVLATAQDLPALAWAAEHTPADALFAVNTRPWQGTLRMGTDAGWWLPLLADRRVTLPAVLYHQGAAEYVEAVNRLAEAIETAPSPDDPSLLDRLRAEGVTHVFVGARQGGAFTALALDTSPHYEPLFVHGPTRIYALR